MSPEPNLLWFILSHLNGERAYWDTVFCAVLKVLEIFVGYRISNLTKTINWIL